MHRARLRLSAAGVLAALAGGTGLITAQPVLAAEPPAGRSAVQRISVQGVIVGRSGRTVQVFARTLSVGRARSTHRLVTLTLPARRRSGAVGAASVPAGATSAASRSTGAGAAGGPSLRIGDLISVRGTGRGAGSSIQLGTLQQEVETPAPARLWVGVIAGVDPATGTLTMAWQEQVDGGQGNGGQGNGGQGTARRAGDGGPDGSGLVVNAAAAAVQLDGAKADPTALAAGQTAVVLGENDHDTVLAASVYAYSQPPSFLSGDVTDVSGTVVTLDADGEPSIDLAPGGTPVPLLLNGNPGATADQLSVGDKLLVIGTDTGNGFTPALAFGFNQQDDGPVGTNDN